ncbi:MAG: ATP-binding protein [Deltaproteobacteria bacterium]|nr:ATP-binding protein [Deltaproteobacteria bacterium]
MKPTSLLTLPAKLENLERFMDLVSAFASEMGFSGKRVQEVQLAVEEALVNVINYAYPEGTPDDVEVRCSADEEGRGIIEIRDRGIPFDGTSLSDPELDAPISERKVGGMGVYLIRKMANEVRYRREGDANILTLAFAGNRGK